MILLQEHFRRGIRDQKYHKEHLSSSHLLRSYKFKHAYKHFKAEWLFYVPLV